MRDHAYGDAGMTVDTLVFSPTRVAAASAVFAEQVGGEALQGGQYAGGGGVADTTPIFVVEHVSAVVDGAFDDPMPPAQVDQVVG